MGLWSFKSCAVCAVVDARLSSALRAPSCLRYEVYICSGDDGDDGNCVSYSKIPPIHGRERTSSDGRYDINFAKIYALRSLSIVSERTDSNDRTDCFALFICLLVLFLYDPPKHDFPPSHRPKVLLDCFDTHTGIVLFTEILVVSHVFV